LLGFTKKETIVIFFLAAGFICGTGIQFIQKRTLSLPEPVNAMTVNAGSVCMDEQMLMNTDEKSSTVFKIHLNTASSDILQQVPGFGPVTAKKIVQYRDQNGPFQSVEDLIHIKGIGPKTIEKIKNYLTVK
jgi:comEA protein